ncbi:hypothetical protein [Flavobacterium sp.]|uniref:hypothetical protein n=1 Tax=Flavobacterium sp. TaxID=239 RepID=UPI0039E4F162
MQYEDLEKFLVTIKRSKSTLRRFYNKNTELSSEIKMKGSKKVYPLSHARYFDSEIMFDENKVLRQENHSMRNLIDCLVDKDSLQYKFWTMEWSLFCAVAYKTDRNKKSCFKQMNALFEHLVTKYENTVIRIFFTTEEFTNRKGFHNHFVIYVEDKKLHEQITSDIKAFFSFDKTDFGIYDKYKAGLFYISKTGLVNEDWDILYNKLDK